jgi:hypothetical protein
MYDIFLVSTNNDFSSINTIRKRFPFIRTANSIDHAKTQSLTTMLWIVWDNLAIVESFNFDFTVPKWDQDYVHVFKNDDEFNGICLLSKNTLISKKEFENRFFVTKKEIDIQASRPKPYDKFNIDTYQDYLNALQSTSTDMFWYIPPDVIPLDSFDFNYRVPKWDHDYVHVFKNDDKFNGICLFPKNTSISNKEFENRFFVTKKEIDIQASKPNPYDKFNITTYDEYLDALTSTSTDMFWYIPPDVIPLDSFDFNYRVPKWDHDYVHVFKNDDKFNGICLFSRAIKISKKEFENRFFVSKKEIDIQASRPKPYDKFNIDTYQDYLDALTSTSTDMFWYIPPDVIPLDSFDFNYRVPKWDHDYVHVFKNKHFFDGICLFPKNTSISIKEFENRFFVSKKEIDIQASSPKPYDKFNIETYQDYLNALQSTSTDMFWCIPNEVEPLPDFNFDLHFNHANTYDRTINHMFKNQDVEDTKYNGIMLMSKHIPVPKREIEFRFLVEKKEHEQVISKLKPYDIVFISYNEPTADINYQRLLSKFSSNTIHRVSGVTGIHAAHLAAAKLSTTPMFWVVDGDAVIEDDFKFDHLVPRYDRYIVHVWHSRNPINDLEYGYGGVKLLPKKQTLEMDLNSTDMTTSISSSLRVMPIVSNITQFNTDAFSTWRSAFRECVKLSSRVILGQQDTETAHRLEVWCTVGDTRPYGQYAIAGAIAGRIYGQDNADNSSALGKINDFNWLRDHFETSSAAIGNI